VADTKGMPRDRSSAIRHLAKLVLVGALVLTGGCTYFWVPDVNNPPKSAPWTPLPTTTSVTDGAKFKDGAVYCDKPTPPTDMGSYTRSVVNCWQDWAHNRVTATTSGRHYYWFVYRHFNDFGSTFNGKFSARWAINDAIALRGAASTGFRAPTPGQQFTQNTQTGFPLGSPVPVATQTARPDSISAQYFGAQSLSPEKSISFSGGLVLTPGGGFNVTADFYNIVVRDRIGITSSVTVTPADQLSLLALGLTTALDLGQVNYFTNGFRTRTQGFDIVISHRADTDAGRFNTSLAVNYNKTKVTDRRSIALSTIRPTDSRVLSLIDDTRRGNIEGNNPRWRAVLSEAYTNGNFDLTARVNYFGSFTSFFAPIGSVPSGVDATAFRALYPATLWPKDFGAEVSIDLEAGVTFAEKYRLAVGVENLFNNYPDVETRNAYPSTGGQANGSLYPGSSPLGQAGGFWYVRATAKF
jgi:iron complex outermembrane receptor protein